MSNIHRVVTLATVHNRKKYTLRCLRSLILACDLAGIESTHVIVDDKSSDGTSEAIKECFPHVTILQGSGQLYWAGGMRYGFRYIRENYGYDYLVAYNDDCIFVDQSIKLLLEGFGLPCAKVGIVIGSLANPQTKKASYGGRILRWRSKWLPPSFILAEPSGLHYKEVDALNMNLCCISKILLDELGFLSKHYLHSGADFDYGLRANRMGYALLLAPSTVGYCDENSLVGTSREKMLSLVVRIRRIFSIKEYPLFQTFVYFHSHGGYLWPFWLVIFYVTRFFHF